MEKLILFRVNSHKKTIDLILDAEENDIKSAEKLSSFLSEMQTLSFDTVLLLLEQFRGSYEKIKDFGSRASEYITKGRDINDVFNAEHTALAEKEKNLFAKFYLERIWETYESGRVQLNKVTGTLANAVTNRKGENALRDKIRNICAEAERVVLTDWHYNHVPDTDTVLLRSNSESFILRGNGVNQMFRVSDGTLLPLLYEYSFAVSDMGLSVFECRYCRRHYLNTADKICCTDENCIKQKKRDAVSNKKDEFSARKKAYCGYVRGLKHTLSTAHKSEYAMDIFKDAQKKANDYIDLKIEEYRDGELPPDTDFDIMEDNVRAEMKKLTDRLLKMPDREIEKIYNDKISGELMFGIDTLK